MTSDEKYMQVALRLARRGIGSVEPNPVVGCIIVKNGQIIGRGWHREFGGPHAEVNALENCQKNGTSPQNAAMYVTLEPCCHHGKTPPCTDMIVEANLAKVVVATLDPSEHAGGKGIEQLHNAGIEVQVGLCEEQAKLINAPFIKFAATGRCWVILKWAQSIDGMLAWASKGGNQRWISGEKSRKDTHRLRRRVQAILVGVGTVLADDPLLTARPTKGKKPIRVVLDSNLMTPVDCKLLATAKKSPVLIVTSQEAISANPSLAKKITEKGAELLAAPAVQGRCDLNFLIDELSKRGATQLLVEGGPTVITSFLKQGLADEICIYIASKILGSQGSVNITEPMVELSKAVGLNYVDIKRFGDDIKITGLLEKTIREISISRG